jgi:anthranilate phosphoribosyltransferase
MSGHRRRNSAADGDCFSHSATQAASGFAAGQPAFMLVGALAPRLAHLLSLRRILGVRNLTHTVVKIMQPSPVLRHG